MYTTNISDIASDKNHKLLFKNICQPLCTGRNSQQCIYSFCLDSFVRMHECHSGNSHRKLHPLDRHMWFSISIIRNFHYNQHAIHNLAPNFPHCKPIPGAMVSLELNTTRVQSVYFNRKGVWSTSRRCHKHNPLFMFIHIICCVMCFALSCISLSRW